MASGSADHVLSGILLTIAYDGTAFSGWARQPNTRTVQGTIESAIEAMNGSPVELRGTSRTDAGVHALGQIAAFDPSRSIAAHGWVRGLNATLPSDVAVVEASACPPGYIPRFDTHDKTYRYLLLCAETRDPLLRDRAWFLGPKQRRSRDRGLDRDAMSRAAATLEGRHDFRAFRSADDERENTIRTVHRIDIVSGFGGDPRLLAFEVRGDAFMKNMVRILVGTLVDVGCGRIDPDELPQLLSEAGARSETGPTAPAHGLYLVQVRLGRHSSTRGTECGPTEP